MTQPTGRTTASKDYLFPLKQGFVVGPIISASTYYIDRLTFRFHIDPPAKVNIFTYLKKSPRGLSVVMLQGGFKYSLISTQPFILQGLNKVCPSTQPINTYVASGIPAALSAYLLSPFSVIKAYLYNEKPLSDITDLKWRCFMNGSHMTAMRELTFFTSFFALTAQLPKVHPLFENKEIAGVTAGVTSGLVSNPFAVVSNKQKISNHVEHATTVIKQTFKSSGAKGFYRGFFQTTCLRMAIQGAVTNRAFSFYKNVINPVKQIPMINEQIDIKKLNKS